MGGRGIQCILTLWSIIGQNMASFSSYQKNCIKKTMALWHLISTLTLKAVTLYYSFFYRDVLIKMFLSLIQGHRFANTKDPHYSQGSRTTASFPQHRSQGWTQLTQRKMNGRLRLICKHQPVTYQVASHLVFQLPQLQCILNILVMHYKQQMGVGFHYTESQHKHLLVVPHKLSVNDYYCQQSSDKTKSNTA